MVTLTPAQLKNVADTLQTGLKCFVHRQTGELVSYPDPLQFPDADDEIWQQESDKVDADPDAYLAIRPMTGREEFRIMEQFTDQIPSKPLQNQLRLALSGAKPFRTFKNKVDDSGEYRQLWFRFRDEQTILWVADQLANDDL